MCFIARDITPTESTVIIIQASEADLRDQDFLRTFNEAFGDRAEQMSEFLHDKFVDFVTTSAESGKTYVLRDGTIGFTIVDDNHSLN
jgi:hypothetical protein